MLVKFADSFSEQMQWDAFRLEVRNTDFEKPTCGGQWNTLITTNASAISLGKSTDVLQRFLVPRNLSFTQNFCKVWRCTEETHSVFIFFSGCSKSKQEKRRSHEFFRPCHRLSSLAEGAALQHLDQESGKLTRLLALNWKFIGGVVINIKKPLQKKRYQSSCMPVVLALLCTMFWQSVWGLLSFAKKVL